MGTWEYELANPPATGRGRELWLQHAAGFILFEDVRGYARECIENELPPKARGAARKGVDHALYGLMMLLDGVAGSLSNSRMRVGLRVAVQLIKEGATRETVLAEVELAHGDGMCMGYHGWKEGDFGEAPLVAAKRTSEARTPKRSSRKRASKKPQKRRPPRRGRASG